MQRKLTGRQPSTIMLYEELRTPLFIWKNISNTCFTILCIWQVFCTALMLGSIPCLTAENIDYNPLAMTKLKLILNKYLWPAGAQRYQLLLAVTGLLGTPGSSCHRSTPGAALGKVPEPDGSCHRCSIPHREPTHQHELHTQNGGISGGQCFQLGESPPPIPSTLPVTQPTSREVTETTGMALLQGYC